MFNLLGAIVSGLFVGWLARFIYPGPVPMGLVMTVLLGIGGSMLASFVTVRAAGEDYRDGINRAGCLSSVLGAMALIYIGRHLL
ncbi:GlsB/YeaQ/YmgE family stress response membrane protein [Novosphingobium sp.]|uniref:GlsB/YeaQ/YmgE family stress response membrane protein n=1 Tax=Novosphingobium sp. TaxID=1874826 RepID=UPI0026352C3C|nr:GlsB/YeaQ/YmgE family stress response membrane protein [Novosphingobium sp.]